MCQCAWKLEHPSPNTVVWWAYLHSMGDIMVHRWHAPVAGKECDLCDAQRQKLQGNDNIIALVTMPFWAESRGEAILAARRLLGLVGHRIPADPLEDDPYTDRFRHII